MRLNEPMQYLQLHGIDPRSRATCCRPGCDTKYIVANGIAYPATNGEKDEEGDVIIRMFFFCSATCILLGFSPQGSA